MKYLGIKTTRIIIIGIMLSFIVNLAFAQTNQQTLRSTISLDGTEWKLIGLQPGEGEQIGINKKSQSEGLIQTTVPNNVQLSIGLKDPYSQDKEVVDINKKEWWYVRSFISPKIGKQQQARLVFDGVDYFADVWLNGEKLGTHEGAFTKFDFDITKQLNLESPNYLAVRVTAPWKVEGRSHYEFMKGEYEETWDALPGPGQVTFPLGLHRSVNLEVVAQTHVELIQVSTISVEDNKADLQFKVAINSLESSKKYKLKVTIQPENFSGSSFDVPSQTFSVSGKADESQIIDFSTTLDNPKLWWTWDMGDQNLYRAQVSIYDATGKIVDNHSTVFGIRTFVRDHKFLYTLNGKPIFLQGAWISLSRLFPAEPDRWIYEKDLRQARHANMNHLVNFTVMEKKEFYNLADSLGILIFVELPFNQLGPLDALNTKSPRYSEYVEWCSKEVTQIVRTWSNHPSIGLWSPVAEVTSEGVEFDFSASWDFRLQEAGKGYAGFLTSMEEIIKENDIDAVYHRSLCDFGEMHFWEGGLWDTYDKNYTNQTNFVSEYGSMAFSSYETIKNIVDTDSLWNNNYKPWTVLNLPVDVGELSYLTGFSYGGLAMVTDYVYKNVDQHPSTLKEFTDATQIYQDFIYGYQGDTWRRKLLNPINGTRSWSFKSFSEKPLCSFGVVDCNNTPLPSFYTQKRTYEPVTMSYVVKYALESVPVGSALGVPVWLSNATNNALDGEIVAGLYNLKGERVQYYHSWVGVGAMQAKSVFNLDIQLPQEPGIYLLRGKLFNGQKTIAEANMYVKVVPKVTKKSPRILLMGTKNWVNPVRDYLNGFGADFNTIIYEPTIVRSSEIPFPESVEQLRSQYDAIWLTGFDNYWREVPESWSEIIVKAVEEGTTFIHTGSWSSFHGADIDRTAALDLTPLVDIIPVEIKAKNDVLATHNVSWVTDRRLLVDPSQEANPKDKITTTDIAPEWIKAIKFPDFEVDRHILNAKPEAKVLLNINDQPLLVTGSYGKGNVIAYLGFSPEIAKDSVILDRVLQTSAEHLLFANISASILALTANEEPTLSIEDLLNTRKKPLFESLKNTQTKEWPEITLKWIKSDDNIPRAQVTIQNGANFMRGLRVRLDGPDFASGKALPLWSNQYFDLLPNETVECTIEIRMKDNYQLGNIELKAEILQGSESKNYSVPQLK